MNYTQVQQLRKKAGLFGNTRLGRGITDLFGEHTFMSDALGASPQDMLDYQADQMGYKAPTGGSEGDYYADVNKHITDSLNHLQRADQGLEQRNLKETAAKEQAEKMIAARGGETEDSAKKYQDQYARRNQELMDAYMSGTTEQLASRNSAVMQGRGPTNAQLQQARNNAAQSVVAHRRQQTKPVIAAIKPNATPQTSKPSYTGVQQARMAPPPQTPAVKPQYQSFNRNNLKDYTADQVNAINAAAQKAGIRADQINRVRFGNDGAVTGINGIGLK